MRQNRKASRSPPTKPTGREDETPLLSRLLLECVLLECEYEVVLINVFTVRGIGSHSQSLHYILPSWFFWIFRMVHILRHLNSVCRDCLQKILDMGGRGLAVSTGSLGYIIIHWVDRCDESRIVLVRYVTETRQGSGRNDKETQEVASAGLSEEYSIKQAAI